MSNGLSSSGYFFEDLLVGQTATLSKTITEADIQMYSVVCLDTNPIHLDEEAGRQSRFGGRVAHGMLSAGLIAALLGTRLPGPGTIYLKQSLMFRAPVRPGQTVRAIVEITDLNLSRKSATLRTRCLVKEDVVIDGEACVLVPARP
ncbi:MAG: 3-hydroxybutyryl-CoA dehydratase [Acetobacteraceae bacterium]|jgi:3-hydroxybutyryl-CoA dehydratase|nr:3-hydroxybutyryl-CoA dehydratase [Acetobacteraceae bacterium]